MLLDVKLIGLFGAEMCYRVCRVRRKVNTVGKEDLQLPVFLLRKNLEVLLSFLHEVLLVQHPLQTWPRQHCTFQLLPTMSSQSSTHSRLRKPLKRDFSHCKLYGHLRTLFTNTVTYNLSNNYEEKKIESWWKHLVHTLELAVFRINQLHNSTLKPRHQPLFLNLIKINIPITIEGDNSIVKYSNVLEKYGPGSFSRHKHFSQHNNMVEE